MIWLTRQEQAKVKAFCFRLAPWALLGFFLLIVGFIAGYEMKGDEIVKDCKYANAFRVATDSFGCVRKI